MVCGGWGRSRRGGVSVPLVAVSGLQVLEFIALRQAISEAGLLHDLGDSGSRHRELCRDVSLGGGGEVGESVGQRHLVNNGRGDGALDGVSLKGPPSARFSGHGERIPYRVDDIRLNPDAGVGGRHNLGVSLSDGVREDLHNRVRHSQGRRIDRETGAGDGDRQGLGVGEVESLSHDIGHGHGVVDRGWDGLKLSEIRN